MLCLYGGEHRGTAAGEHRLHGQGLRRHPGQARRARQERVPGLVRLLGGELRDGALDHLQGLNSATNYHIRRCGLETDLPEGFWTN